MELTPELRAFGSACTELANSANVLTRTFLIIALVATPTFSASVSADDTHDRERAREAYAAGLSAVEHDQLDLAIDNFKLAQAILPHETTAIAIATVQERQGRYEAALETLESFFADPETRSPEVRAQIERLRSKLPATLQLTSEKPGWTIRIDGETEAGQTPTQVKVTPGPHRVELISPQGERVTEQRTMHAGVTYEVHGAHRQRASDEGGTNVAAWLFAGASLAALGTGIGFGVAALDAQSDYQASPTQERYDDTKRYSLVSDIAFAGAAVFAVGTVASLLLDASDDEHPARNETVLRIEPVAGAHTVGVQARGAF